MKNLSLRLQQSVAAIALATAVMGASAQNVVYDTITNVTASGNFYGQCLGAGCGPDTSNLFGSGSPTMLAVGDHIKLGGTETVLTGFQFSLFFDTGFSGNLSLDARLELYSTTANGLASIPLGTINTSVFPAISNPFGQAAPVFLPFSAGLDLSTYLNANNREIYYALQLTPVAASATSGFGVGLADAQAGDGPSIGTDIGGSTSSWFQVNVGNAQCLTCSDPTVLQLTENLLADGFTPAVRFYAVAPIPEPSTYAMMIAGLVGVGFMARRRNSGSKA